MDMWEWKWNNLPTKRRINSCRMTFIFCCSSLWQPFCCRSSHVYVCVFACVAILCAFQQIFVSMYAMLTPSFVRFLLSLRSLTHVRVTSDINAELCRQDGWQIVIWYIAGCGFLEATNVDGSDNVKSMPSNYKSLT